MERQLGMMAALSSRTARVISGTVTGWLQFFCNLALQLLLIPIIIRIAHQETLGAYAILMQFIGYLALVDLGLSATTMRYLAQAQGRDDHGERFREVLSIARTLLLATNVIFGFLVFSSVLWIQYVVNLSPTILTEARMSICMLALWALIRSPWVVFAGGLRATQQIATANIIYMVGTVSRLLLSLVFVYAHMGLTGLMLAGIISEAIATCLFAVFFYRNNRGLRLEWRMPDQKLLGEMLVFSVHLLVINVSSLLIYSTDNLVIGFLYGAAAVSVYYATQTPAITGYNLFLSIATNASPAINELFARGEMTALRGIFLRIHKLTLLLVLPFSIGVVVLNGPFISLWVGNKQYGGGQITSILAVLIITLCLSGVSNIFLQAKGELKFVSLAALIEGFANIVLSLWLGKEMGIAGVVLGTLITHLPSTVYLQWRAQRDLGISWPVFALESALTPIILTAIAGAFLCLCVRLVPPDSWPRLCLVSGSFVTFYGILCYRFGLEAKDKQRALTYIRSKTSTRRFFAT